MVRVESQISYELEKKFSLISFSFPAYSARPCRSVPVLGQLCSPYVVPAIAPRSSLDDTRSKSDQNRSKNRIICERISRNIYLHVLSALRTCVVVRPAQLYPSAFQSPATTVSGSSEPRICILSYDARSFRHLFGHHRFCVCY